jgi:hypothetical protein
MATKKLSPKADHLSNPSTKIQESNPSPTGERYAPDTRNPQDQDANEDHARRRGQSSPPVRGAFRERVRPRK